MNKIIKIAQNNKNEIYNTLGYVIPMFAGFIFLPMIQKTLSAEKYGLLIIIWLFTNLVGLMDFGMTRALTNKLSLRNTGHTKKDITQEVGTLSLISIIIFLISLTLKNIIFKVDVDTNIQFEIDLSYYLTCLSIPFIILTSGLRGALEGLGEFRIVNLLRVPLMAYNYIVPAIIILAQSTNIFYIALLLFLGRFLFFILHYISLKEKVIIEIKNFKIFNIQSTFSTLNNIKWLAVIATLSPILGSLDRWIVNGIVNTKQIGYYATPYEIVSRLGIIPSALIAVMIPTMLSSRNHNESPVSKSIAYIDKTIYIMLPITTFFGLFSYEFLALWMNTEFAQLSFLFLTIFSCGILLNSVAGVPINYLMSVGNEDLVAKNYIYQIIYYPLILIAATLYWGAYGAASIWFIRIFIDLYVGFVKSSFLSEFRITKLAGLIFFQIFVILYQFYYQSEPVYIKVAIYVFTLLVCGSIFLKREILNGQSESK